MELGRNLVQSEWAASTVTKKRSSKSAPALRTPNPRSSIFSIPHRQNFLWRCSSGRRRMPRGLREARVQWELQTAAGAPSVTFIILIAGGSPTCQRLLPPPPSLLHIRPKLRYNVHLRRAASKNAKKVSNDPKEMNKFRFMGHLGGRSAHKAAPPHTHTHTSGYFSALVGLSAFIQKVETLESFPHFSPSHLLDVTGGLYAHVAEMCQERVRRRGRPPRGTVA